jgi:hypothetical protein
MLPCSAFCGCCCCIKDATEPPANCRAWEQYTPPGVGSCRQCPYLGQSTSIKDKCICGGGYRPLDPSASSENLVCKGCTGGTFSYDGDATCRPCVGDTYSILGGPCFDCPTGTEATANKRDCQCALGSWSSCTKSGDKPWRMTCQCSNATGATGDHMHAHHSKYSTFTCCT